MGGADKKKQANQAKKRIFKIQEYTHNQIKELDQWVKDNGNSTDLSMLKARLDLVQDYRSTYKDYQQQLIMVCVDAELDDDFTNTRVGNCITVENLCCDIKAKLLELIDEKEAGRHLSVSDSIAGSGQTDDEENTLGARVTRSCIYVDDMLAGASTTEEATELMKQVTGILSTGSCVLSKFCFNSSYLLNLVEEHT